jgi:hypothetical protein
MRYPSYIALFGALLLAGCSQPPPTSGPTVPLTLAFNFANAPELGHITQVLPVVENASGQVLTFNSEGQEAPNLAPLPPLTSTHPQEVVYLPAGSYTVIESAQDGQGDELAWGSEAVMLNGPTTAQPQVQPVIEQVTLSLPTNLTPPFSPGAPVPLSLSVLNAAGEPIPPTGPWGPNYAVTYSVNPQGAATLSQETSQTVTASLSGSQSATVTATVTGMGPDHNAGDQFTASATLLGTAAALPTFTGTFNPSATSLSQFPPSGCSTSTTGAYFGSNNSIIEVCVAGDQNNLYIGVQYAESGNTLFVYISLGPGGPTASLSGLNPYPELASYQTTAPNYFLLAGFQGGPALQAIIGPSSDLSVTGSGLSLTNNYSTGTNTYVLNAEIPWSLIGGTPASGTPIGFSGGIFGGDYGAGTVFPGGNTINSSSGANYAVVFQNLLSFYYP